MNVPVFCVQQIAPSGINEVVWYNFGLNVPFLDLIFHREVFFSCAKKYTISPRTTREFISRVTNRDINVKCQVLMSASHKQTKSSTL